MVRTFEHGLSRPTGFVLPIQRWNAAASTRSRWISERWPLAPRQIVPGAGRFAGRLSPADEVAAFVPPVGLSLHPPAGPDGAARAAARARSISSRSSACRRRRAADRRSIAEQVAEDGAVRTALSIEPRDGVLCVFMPPVPKLDDYLELLAAVEETARDTGHAGAHRRLCAALRSAHRSHQGDARPRRDRGQYPSRRAHGARRWRRRPRSMRTRARRGSASTNS